MLNLPDRLLAKILVSDTCWLWTGSVTSTGYGRAWNGTRSDWVHRIVYELTVGPIPTGLEIDHVCHMVDKACLGGAACPHRRCVRPDHLEAVTKSVNSRRSRQPELTRARHARQTHCRNGHPLVGVNLRMNVDGRRVCKTCSQDAQIRYRARHLEELRERDRIRWRDKHAHE